MEFGGWKMQKNNLEKRPAHHGQWHRRKEYKGNWEWECLEHWGQFREWQANTIQEQLVL